MTLNSYYIQELKHLREIAVEFAKDNPAVAPKLGEPSDDPDVERLLEGVAFIAAGIRQKIDDEIPEIIHDMIRQVWPNFLRPLPSLTLIAVTPGDNISQSARILSGTFLDSIPLGGKVCRFRTCHDVDVHPMDIKEVVYEEPAGKKPFIRISFQLKNVDTAGFKPERLRLHLGGHYVEAANLYLSLMRDVNEILIHGDKDESVFRLGSERLKPMGFSPFEAMIPWPSNVIDGFRLFQEYVLMPERFLSAEIDGIDQWTPQKDTRIFHVDLVLDRPCEGKIKPGKNSFALSVVPAINLFPHSAVPLTVDHTKTQYPIRPENVEEGKYQVYSIEKVTGVAHGAKTEISLGAFHDFKADRKNYLYHEHVKANPVKDIVDMSISIACPPDRDLPDLKSLSFEILCTDGYFPEHLAEGDIRIPESKTEEFISFRNIRKPTVAALPPLGTDHLWQLTSLMSLNHATLGCPDNLKTRLKLFLLPVFRDKNSTRVIERRIDGIRDLKAIPVSRLVSGSMTRGIEIRMDVSMSHFAGPGDIYLFGTVLDRFFAAFVSINSFTRLVINDKDSGEIYTWKERLGHQPLI